MKRNISDVTDISHVPAKKKDSSSNPERMIALGVAHSFGFSSKKTIKGLSSSLCRTNFSGSKIASSATDPTSWYVYCPSLLASNATEIFVQFKTCLY
jgi:hypothetical protein